MTDRSRCNLRSRQTSRSRYNLRSYSRIDIVNRAMEAVLSSNFLHWSEAVVVGTINRACRSHYKDQGDYLLKPLLCKLESIMGSNIHQCCGQIYAPKSQRCCTCFWGDDDDYHCSFIIHPLQEIDPRYNDELYDILTVEGKCATMTSFLHKINGNFLRQVDITLSSHHAELDVRALSIYTGFYTSMRNEDSREMLRQLTLNYRYRAQFLLNVMIIGVAVFTMEEGHNDFLCNAFLGRGPIEPSEFCGCVLVLCERFLHALTPFTNTRFTQFLRGYIYPSKKTMAFLGPLIPKVFLGAPLFHLVPPIGHEGGQVRLPDILGTLNLDWVLPFSMRFETTTLFDTLWWDEELDEAWE